MQVIVVSSVMLSFISCWRTAAVVLGDLASTAYYIGGIVENSIGPAAPWLILGVMLFSYAVRSVYIESCSLFVRGGVYRVVKEAMGGSLAKLSVSALMFDYMLTGPISAASAGQYIMGLLLESLALINPALRVDPDTADLIRRWGSVVIACAITLYFFRQNLLGLHESSAKALKIMIVTTVVAAVLLVWCFITLAVWGPANDVPLKPNLAPKVEYETVPAKEAGTGSAASELRPRLRDLGFDDKEVWKLGPDGQPAEKIENGRPVPRLNEATGRQEDPLGFINWLWPGLAKQLHEPGSWLSIIGVIGLLIAFAHSILAMSGEETLAQVYREVESPKLPNFKKAAFIVFLYSLGLTATVSFLAVLLIPNEVRMKFYSDNLLGGLAMSVIGPPAARLVLNAAVVVAGFLILSGAVNTAIIGANGVLNRVAEDGVMPDWFLNPHRRYGTTHRLLYLILVLQLAVILLSRGDMYVLGEAYAFGIVWSFAFKALAMVVLRFRDRSPREFKVPLNLRIRGVEVPIGLTAIFLVLLAAAILNTLTKEVAAIGGVAFTGIFLGLFMGSEYYHEKKRGQAAHKHLEQFNQSHRDEVTPDAFKLFKPYRKLVAIRSSQNLFMLERALDETDPETTDTVVATAKPIHGGSTVTTQKEFDYYDRELMTAVVNRAERAGKKVHPLIIPTNNPLFALVHTAQTLQAQELVLGLSNKHTATEQLEQIAFYWMNLNEGEPRPLTVRVLSRSCDISYDLDGGSRIPKITERHARSVAELRSAGIGVRRAMLVYQDNPESHDLFTAVLTMLDPNVALTVGKFGGKADTGALSSYLERDLDRAQQVNRELQVLALSETEPDREIIRLVEAERFDLLIIGQPSMGSIEPPIALDTDAIMRQAPCRVCLVSSPVIPDRVDAS